MTTAVAFAAFVLVGLSGVIAFIWREEPQPAVWVAAVLGTLGLILAFIDGTTGVLDLGTVFGVVVLSGILGAGWHPARRRQLIVAGFAGLSVGAAMRIFALATLLDSASPATGNVVWDVARSAGFVAFLAATGAVILGARRPSRLPLRGLPARIYALHRALGIAALAALSVHLGSLLFDTYIGLGVYDIFVAPWSGTYRPFAMTLGWLAMILLILTAASGGLRKYLPGWRIVHALAYVTFFVSLAHSVLAGSDTGSPWIIAVYVISAVAVSAALLMRVLPVRNDRRKARQSS